VRIVRTAAAGVQIDERGKVPGRGAYLCRQESCWQAALESQSLQQALKAQLSEDERVALEQYRSERIKHLQTARQRSQ
jgi:predicted RNA-binding protein YlxR (DUF448 family)